MKNIFILSQHRTGSTLLKNILNSHPNVHIAFDEMNIFDPFKKNTLDKLLNSKIKTSNDLIGAIKKKQIYGTFWSDFEKSGIDLDIFKDEIDKHHKFNLVSILFAVLTMLRKINKTEIVGIKYPIHYSKLDFLIDNFPDSKIIFLTRNPKSIVASKLKDPATVKRKSKSILHRFLTHYFTLLHFSLEFKKSVQLYQKNKNILFKVNYESLILDSKNVLNLICSYCDIEFQKEMLNVRGKQSSHYQKNIKGLNHGSLYKFKSTLSNFDMWIIDIITSKYYKLINQ